MAQQYICLYSEKYVSFYSAMFNKDGPATLSKKREKMNGLVNPFAGEYTRNEKSAAEREARHFCGSCERKHYTVPACPQDTLCLVSGETSSCG